VLELQENIAERLVHRAIGIQNFSFDTALFCIMTQDTGFSYIKFEKKLRRRKFVSLKIKQA